RPRSPDGAISRARRFRVRINACSADRRSAVRRRFRHRQDDVRRGDRRRPRPDLYTVDLATAVDKYVGETEKNLERIFTEVAGVNGVLLFDEAAVLDNPCYVVRGRPVTGAGRCRSATDR